MALDFVAPDFDGVDLRIGIVQARFNEWAGRALAEACVNELITLGVDEDDITHITVPGALEVPLALARLAATEDYDALVAIGCVIRGETYQQRLLATGTSQEGLRNWPALATQSDVPAVAAAAARATRPAAIAVWLRVL